MSQPPSVSRRTLSVSSQILYAEVELTPAHVLDVQTEGWRWIGSSTCPGCSTTVKRNQAWLDVTGHMDVAVALHDNARQSDVDFNVTDTLCSRLLRQGPSHRQRLTVKHCASGVTANVHTARQSAKLCRSAADNARNLQQPPLGSWLQLLALMQERVD